MEEKKLMQTTAKLIAQPSTYNLIIPSSVEDKIRFLCSEINNVEWSGILFYTYTGSFETDDLTITCRDICVMDIGTSGYTEFTESPDVIAYQLDHKLLDCSTGLIHSHNSMPTFFSGTDKNTLLGEGDYMNNFVSLIVNNDGKYTAAITRKVKHIKDVRDSKTYKFFGQGERDLGSSQYYEEENEVQYFMLNITKEHSLNNELLSRLQEIRKTKITHTNAPFFDYKNPSTIAPIENKKPSEVKKPVFNTENDLESIPYGEIDIDDTTIETIALKILSGNIFWNNKRKLTVKEFLDKSKSYYKEIFKDKEDFKYWVENNTDSIINITHLKEIEFWVDDIDIQQALLAYELLCLFEEEEKSNEYIKIICDALNKYII